MQIGNISIGLALIAGVASFLSPCVLALVPAYVGYLGGRAAGGDGGSNNRVITFSHGIAFVLGFSLVFVVLGVAASALGGVLYDVRTWLGRVGGIIVIIFGLHMIGIIRIPLLEYDTRVMELPDPKFGYLSSVLMGVFFSAGWAPCVGPVLGSILTLAMNGGSISKGVIMLSAYSAGLAIPFLIAALGIGWVTTILRKYGKIMHYTEIFMGILMIIVGIMLATGAFNIIATMFPGWSFGL